MATEQITEPGKPAPRVDAPWTEEQVRVLNMFQKSGVWHPFTSTNGVDLIATKDGWVEEEGGPVVQTWAHSFMVNEKAITERMDLLLGNNRMPKVDTEDTGSPE